MEYRLTDPLTALERCPQCGISRPCLNLQSIVTADGRRYGHSRGWAVYQCTACTDIIAFECEDVEPQTFGSPVPLVGLLRNASILQVIPKVANDLGDWPAQATRYMEQALASLAAPDGAVMLAGSAVDAMLKATGLDKGSVYERINTAVEQGLLTGAMGEWAHAVRLSANAPRHADLDAPHSSVEEAQASIEFTKALGQFLFSLPAKVERGRQAAQKANPKAITKA